MAEIYTDVTDRHIARTGHRYKRSPLAGIGPCDRNIARGRTQIQAITPSLVSVHAIAISLVPKKKQLLEYMYLHRWNDQTITPTHPRQKAGLEWGTCMRERGGDEAAGTGDGREAWAHGTRALIPPTRPTHFIPVWLKSLWHQLAKLF